MEKEIKLEQNKEIEGEEKKEKNLRLIRKLIQKNFPQVGAYKSYDSSLSHKCIILGCLRHLVRIYVSVSLELTKLVVTHLDATFSLMKWLSTSMCLVLSRKTWLDAIQVQNFAFINRNNVDKLDIGGPQRDIQHRLSDGGKIGFIDDISAKYR